MASPNAGVGALVAKEGSVNSDSKSKGVGCKDGKSGGKMQTVTMGMEVFDCHICFKPLRPPIFQCSGVDYSICSSCWNTFTKRERSGHQRCDVMERVVDNIFIPCKHGCNKKITYYEKGAHEEECPMGPCVCPVSGCRFTAPTTMLLDHLTTLHKLPKRRIQLFESFWLPVQPGSQVLYTRHDRLFLLDMVALESFGHAVSLVCVRPETPRATVDVHVEFSKFEGHIQVSKFEIKPDEEPKQCVCVVPGRESDIKINIMICMAYYDNNDMQEEEEEEDDEMHEYDNDSDQDEEDDKEDDEDGGDDDD